LDQDLAAQVGSGGAGGERSGSMGAGGEQTAAGARRRFAITQFRLDSTQVLHGEVARDARNAIAASTRRISGGEAALWRAATEQSRRARARAQEREGEGKKDRRRALPRREASGMRDLDGTRWHGGGAELQLNNGGG